MYMIFKIAKAELRILFNSPVAWIVLFLFFVVCGASFALPLSAHFRMQRFFQEFDEWNGFNGHGLTWTLISKPSSELLKNLYLFIPLLTMGIINRETSSGSIKLLYSSPIRVRDIVLGKYLGTVMLISLFILFFATILMVIPSLITGADGKRYIATILGFFLVVNVYVAIGLFVSCLTNYQIIAGIVTFLVFFGFNSISNLWQQYDFIRDITYFLSIGGRAENLLYGLITSRDVCYFILITVLFLGCSMIKLKSTQESRSWRVAASRYSLVTLIVLTLGYVSAISGKVLYWDTTREQTNTIHPEIQSVLQELDGSPLTITLYTNLLGKNAVHGLPQNRNFYVWKIWEQYRRFYPNMVFKYEYYYDLKEGDSVMYIQNPGLDIHEIAEKAAKELGIRKSFFKTPDAIKKLVDFKDEAQQLVMKLTYKDKNAWLRTFDDASAWPQDVTIAGSIKRLTRVSPKVLFSIDNYERDPSRYGAREYGAHTMSPYSRSSLMNHGVDCDTISLDSRALPDSFQILVVADPRSEMTVLKQLRIKDYIKKGGNAIILGEPYKAAFLNPVLQSTGVTLDEGMIVNANKDEMPHILNATINDAGAHMADENSMDLYKKYKKERIDAKLIGAANVTFKEINGFKTEPILELRGDEDNWVEMGHLVVDSAAPVFSALEDDYRKDSYTIGVKLERSVNNKHQKMVVLGDADLLSDERFGRQGLSYYSWLLDNQYPSYINRPEPKDLYIKATATTIKAVSWAYLYVVPAIVLVSGMIVLIRRKRK